MFGTDMNNILLDKDTSNIIKIKDKLKKADAVVIGAGAGMSTSAGFTYSGERFHKYFQDFIEKYGFKDMYSGGFYDFEFLEEHWAYWSRYIYINRYLSAPKNTYRKLYELVKDKNYFVITTNVDHCFQKAGFNKENLFYTQGDYGLFQCSEPCNDKVYDNDEIIYKMIKSQGIKLDTAGEFDIRESSNASMIIDSKLVPYCPKCGKPMSMNLRADDTFVEDDGWRRALSKYEDFLMEYRNKKTIFLELGVGMNTPSIIKYNFWRFVNQWPNALYVCINLQESFVPKEIKEKSVCIDEDIDSVLEYIKLT